ncbi:DUF4886 domain-containing protein [Robertkochia marina]|uniref:DUF4886 domain-containing protein n=1 Tax=Robertkochia marina TaxID=1227945 RepID=A0A4S3LY50_9FLAO|nr:DUF4886 domain-containing protein [Robertkochia marina]THD65861.1 DUF4886 domain-containing protein [Robertkochia marina]TRZ41364.1 DUF4886 domain-containing protein [Robertkochia marina]
MKYLPCFLMLIFSIFSFSQEDPKQQVDVLFIGNSLTYYHDMPLQVQQMLNETHPHFKIAQSTFPGMQLSGHLDQIIVSQTENSISTFPKVEGEVTQTEKVILQQDWDIIIMQTGGVGLLIPENRKDVVNEAIEKVKILATNPNCKFVIFNTWPHKNTYPKQYCHSAYPGPPEQGKKNCSPVLHSLEDELAVLNKAYQSTASETGIARTDHGSKFYTVIKNHPDIELYEDTYHPNENGAFLNACVFYTFLTGSDATQLKFTGNIHPETAAVLKEVSRQEERLFD